MNRITPVGVVVASLALVASVATAVRTTAATTPRRQFDIAAERAMHDADIAFYSSRVTRDPTGAIDHLHLAALYLQRARERAAPADLGRAESEARMSLANRRAHNSEAWHTLALALVGQHKFLEAHDAADSLLSADPTSSGPRSLVGEIDLELGRYLEADTIFTALDRRSAEAPVLARVARWASLRGDAEHARDVLAAAREKVHHQAGTPAEQVAWYDLRLGEMALAQGELAEAAGALQHALDVAPDDPRILLALTRLALARHDGKDALHWANAAMNAGEDPLAFALASDANAMLGRRDDAARMFRAFETAINAAPANAWHRQWRLELLDHDRQVPAVLSQAELELHTRPDIYGWDQYAWALHHAGRDNEARVAMQNALKWHTQDALLDAHAAALGLPR